MPKPSLLDDSASWKQTYVVNIPHSIRVVTLEWFLKGESKFWNLSYAPDSLKDTNDLTLGEVIEAFLDNDQHARKTTGYAMWGHAPTLGEEIRMIGTQEGRQAMFHALHIRVSIESTETLEKC
ncbi:hypothetical protein LTR78_000979 [Recurvomyces mirabilis]|uniref:Uncharacterized protein n=1 Tax=Recurvomyces mirabilis TaxID=574656 RepID=A0AAE1C607_9PEZI|nr:hypothetical protein LTR78_000979 [Recurvomyces mirabilis]KAK5158951.1 hypothetical protein LTS14_003059 [Recurvomyces mirabilis]